MKKADLDLYTDYLLSSCGVATATGLSAMVDEAVSHDKVTRFLSERQYTSKDLWAQVKSTVRTHQSDEGVLIFDDTIQEKGLLVVSCGTQQSELLIVVEPGGHVDTRVRHQTAVPRHFRQPTPTKSMT